jgi:hypothetical protein
MACGGWRFSCVVTQLWVSESGCLRPCVLVCKRIQEREREREPLVYECVCERDEDTVNVLFEKVVLYIVFFFGYTLLDRVPFPRYCDRR